MTFFICRSDCSKKTAFNVANNLISLSFNKNYDIAPKRSKDEIIKIPDPNFKQYLINYFDTDGDGEISIAEALGIKEIYCKKQGIKSLKGIEAFENLVKLTCSFNDLCDLDISQLKKLTYLVIATAALGMVACTGNKAGYVVTGTVEGAADGDTVYWMYRKILNSINLTVRITY